MSTDQSEYNRIWEREHRAERNAYQAMMYEQNKERYLAYRKKWREKNREALKAKKRAWYLANQEKLKQRALDYYKENAETVKVKVRLRGRKKMGIVDAPDETRHGICPICDKLKKLVCDHDHSNGLVRGWVCNWCNMRMEQNEKLAAKFKAYLAAYHRRTSRR